MASKYSKLCIDKSKITDWIKLWGEENLDTEFKINIKENKNRIQYSIESLDSTIKIDFIKCSGGLLTIYPNVGTCVEKSKLIAESIYERVSNVLKESPFAHGFSIIVSNDDFEAIIEIVREIDGVSLNNYSEQLQEGKAKYYLYQFAGPAGDKVTIKYFISTNRMQLQGKPLWLFNEIVSMISENGASADDVVDAQLSYCNINMNKSDIYEEMEVVLGSELYSFLSNTQKAILSTSFILSKIDIEMPDYSGIIQQALRAFEGFTKKVYAQKGLQCDGDKQLGMFFTRPDKMSPFTMQKKYSQTLYDEMERKLTSMYEYYYKNRHPYAHSTAYDYDTRVISNRKKADEFFNQIIKSMITWYKAVIL